ncbi:MAG: phage major capsid protein [Paracoccus sp. (in: a-proteobacteria)]|uniref:phage major capsid protein n=1 Tax=unclassified Paracoccus (in: a-proteobacteria) TaxID=2688777 RepID=UPI000C3740F7|nr:MULTISPECIES: phage major capsid protein [unclassified Paracoccus (in: a-proteobacteria)]MAN57092.1 phage major capsid protein [Paracoccus sp. (in: a-proteobacteria)]MBA50123.1 phage major capsid protein [Paracoccus sp. (in: a-proteobacteria)]HIC67252.1 phage major capsid protein [Paracoccus sp. (in: a-proteobacteria)]
MTEVKAAGGGDASADLKGAMTGFVSELRGFRDDIQKKLNAQEERMNMLDRKTAIRGRAPLSTVAETEVPHQKAFNAYLRSGDDDGLRGLAVEEKGLSVASDGGFLAAPQVADSVQSVLSTGASLRKLANVVTVESSAYEVLVDKGDMGAGWADEAEPVESGAGGVERISIPVHELSAMPKASQRLLDDAAFDVEAWLAERIADKFARSEAAAFISGDGVSKPKGILAYPTAPNDSAGAGEIGVIGTGAIGEFNSAAPADPLIDLIYALPAEYRANASFVMNSKTAAQVRKMKDADGRFLWSDALAAGQVPQLLGYPVLISEDMPDIGFDALAIAFGDFHAAYTIVERPDLRVLRDPFSAKPHVLFYATKRVGGGVTDFRAVKFLQFA